MTVFGVWMAKQTPNNHFRSVYGHASGSAIPSRKLQRNAHPLLPMARPRLPVCLLGRYIADFLGVVTDRGTRVTVSHVRDNCTARKTAINTSSVPIQRQYSRRVANFDFRKL